MPEQIAEREREKEPISVDDFLTQLKQIQEILRGENNGIELDIEYDLLREIHLMLKPVEEVSFSDCLLSLKPNSLFYLPEQNNELYNQQYYLQEWYFGDFPRRVKIVGSNFSYSSLSDKDPAWIVFAKIQPDSVLKAPPFYLPIDSIEEIKPV
jgi:hypothetical protein